MEEAKIRLDAMEMALNGRTGFIAPLVSEFCYLQLRMLCEIIALGCLVAHGEIIGTQTKKLRKAWSAAEIMDELDKLHPWFYPMPFKVIETGVGTKTFEILNSSEYLTKSELKTLNGKCGDVLHRGDVQQVRLNGLRINIRLSDPEIAEIVGWANRINALLGNHLIPLLDGHKIYGCQLRTEKSDRVAMSEFHTAGPIWPTHLSRPAKRE